ncbi:MAG: phosphoenolpyruvate--protein phosphotransferase [Gracilibacteraceae bacterium]|jgi:phosphotransferase system enzyme I (PtsI)|nr:phosphoenolpyruvate--protein phosphotransferase [Gracilibacteraceae bacterium]
MMKGVAVSPGIGIGKAFLLIEPDIRINSSRIESECCEEELNRLNTAAEVSQEQLKAIYKKALERMGRKDAEIIKAHIMILEDPFFMDAIREKITSSQITAENALKQTIEEHVQMFKEIEDPYIRERAADISDVGMRFLKNLLGISFQNLDDIEEDIILVGYEITPSQMAMLDRKYIKGIVSETGGITSHTAIIARNMDIPAVLGVSGIMEVIKENQLIAIDGYKGIVEVDPDSDRRKELFDSLARKNAIRKKLSWLINAQTRTRDGKQVELLGNIGKPDEALEALQKGAEGIGLFRTEFLYMDRSTMPDEEEQFEAYKKAAAVMDGRPVIIRTLDIGGDKEIPYFNLPKEANPFLGWRAIRVCFEMKEMFKAQLRAILRAGAFGNVRLMYPMIATVDEVARANSILEEARQELRERGEAFDEQMKVGIMVEIPSAAITSDHIIKEVDFFSIGTNDLTQYTLAVDRMNEKVSSIYKKFSPSVLRLIKKVIDVSHNEGKVTAICGELAGNPEACLLLLGLGLDEFSMNASSIIKIRKIITSVDFRQAELISKRAMELEDAVQIEEYLLQELKNLGLDYLLEL